MICSRDSHHDKEGAVLAMVKEGTKE